MCHYLLFQPILAGNTPLRGLNDDELGPRFPAVSDAYDPELQQFVINAAEKLNFRDRIQTDGTYCFVSGPNYESRAECRFLRSIGGDTVGMSTVPEVLAAKHCGMKVLCLSLVTNKVVTKADESNHASHGEVLEAVEASGRYVEAIVKEISKAEILGNYLSKLPVFTYQPKAKAGAAVTVETTSDDAKKAGSCCGKSICGKDQQDSTTATVFAIALAGATVGLYFALRPRK